MPIYCYSTEDGRTFDKWFPMGQAPSTVYLDDGETVAKRDFGAEWRGCSKPGSGWPMKPCVSTGVNAAQAQELRDFYKRHGETIEVTNSGDPIYTSQRQMNRDLKRRGFLDMN